MNSYEEERAAVGKALLRFTERGLKMATTSDSILEALRDALMPVITQLQPVQKAMLGFISETAIGYRSSSIVADHGGDGDLRAGTPSGSSRSSRCSRPATSTGMSGSRR